MSIRVSAENFDIEVLKASGVVVVDFYSDSCVPCKRMSPVLAEIEENALVNVKFVKININYDAELAKSYGVQSVPTLVLFKEGNETARLQGAKSKAEIEEAIKGAV